MMDIKTDADIKAKLKWFQVLTTLYEIAMPRVEAFTGLQCREIEEGKVDMETINKNANVLKQLLAVIDVLQDPPVAELSRTKKYFETALSNCLAGSEALIKYVQCSKDEAEYQTHLDCLINALVLAREYSESTYKSLNIDPN